MEARKELLKAERRPRVVSINPGVPLRMRYCRQIRIFGEADKVS